MCVFTVIPTIQHGPQVFSTIEGTPISLPCRASGVPTPDITWAKVCIDIISPCIRANEKTKTLLGVINDHYY